MSTKDKIKALLSDGLKEIDLSDYPFGKVREALEELGYYLDQDDDWINGWSVDYCTFVYNDKGYTDYMLSGSLWYGTCNLVKENV